MVFFMTKNRKEPKKIECLNCKKLKSAESNYYINVNRLISSERFPICRICINNFIDEKSSEGYMERVKMVLSLLNRPLINDLWSEMEEDWNRYIRPVSSLSQYNHLNFIDSDFLKHSPSDSKSLIKFEDENYELSNDSINDLIEFWGKGYSLDDLVFLQREYEKLINSYECDTYAMEMLFQEVSHLRLTITKRRQEGNQVDKELKTLQDLLGSANIKPVQETGANAAEQATFGTLIKKWENDRPVPEPDEAWKDVDGIGKYIKTWFFGQLTKMMGMKGKHTDEFEEELEKYTVKPPQYEVGED